MKKYSAVMKEKNGLITYHSVEAPSMAAAYRKAVELAKVLGTILQEVLE